MKMKKMLALALALVTVLALVACGGDSDGKGGTTAPQGSSTTESTSGNVAYKVSVVDALGNPYNKNIVVKFLQNGEQVAMQNVNEEGVATKELEPGEYTVELVFTTDGALYHYDTENLTVSASAPELTIELARMVGEGYEYLFADEKDHNAPYLTTGCTYVELTAGVRNYFVFVPVQSGIFEFTVHNADATVGCYGSPFFVLTESSGTVTGEHSMTVEVKDSMIGSGEGGTSAFVIGIDAGEATENCVISIARVGDYELTPEEMPWELYEPTYTPDKYTLPEGVTLQEFDLSASYNLVFNETDGFYHLDSADGPVVLVRLYATLSYGGSFGDILAHVNVGTYFYGEDGTFLRKELYNDCLLQYLGTLNKGLGVYSYSGGMMDDTYGVYPLTEDLAYIIQSYGEYMGWWTIGRDNYLFADIPNLNTEMAWLFMCCYAE